MIRCFITANNRVYISIEFETIGDLKEAQELVKNLERVKANLEKKIEEAKNKPLKNIINDDYTPHFF